MIRSKYHLRLLAVVPVLAVGLLATVVDGSDTPATPAKSVNEATPEKQLVATGSPTAEWLINPDFEAQELTGWSLIEFGGAVGQMGREATVRKGGTNSHSLRFTVVNPGQRCGVCNRGNAGISVNAGSWYDLTFQARTEKRENDRGYGLTVSLESTDGGKVFARTTLPEVGGDWNGYTVALHAYSSGLRAKLVITMSEPGTIWLDDVSLLARATDGNQTR